MAYLPQHSTHIYKYFFNLDIYNHVQVGAFLFACVCILKLCSKIVDPLSTRSKNRINTSETGVGTMRPPLNIGYTLVIEYGEFHMKPLESLGHGGYCSRCNTIKPIAEFMRPLSTLQAKARGYSGMRRIEVESSMCKDCQPKPRPVSKLRAAEIQQRVSQGSLDPITAKLEMTKRHARAKMSRKLHRAKQAQQTWAAQFKDVIKPMSAHIIGVDNWLRYQARKGTPPEAPSMVFMAEYLAQLRRERDRIKTDPLMNPGPPEHKAWQQYTPHETRLELWKKWDALPPEERQRTTHTPPLLATYKET